MQNLLEQLVGSKVKKIFFNENCLKFETDKGDVILGVERDCCSTSVFYDFYGVKKLLENGKVLSVKKINLAVDEREDRKKYQDSIEAYGFEIVTENKEFGEQTSVFSFRNYSNGYYGGDLTNRVCFNESVPEITDDVVETANLE